MFTTCGLMVQDLVGRESRDLKLRGFLKKISRYHVMILDDIGYVQYSREEMEVLFALWQSDTNGEAWCSPAICRFPVGSRSSKTR